VTATNPTSSPESTGDYIASPQVIPYFNQFGGLMVMVPSQEVVPPSNQTPPPSSPPQQDMLTLLRHQIEYYFSKDNLATDKYLLSQMDGDHFVPISVLANFNQVKRLSSDVNLIIEAVKESNSLQLDPTNTKIRAIPEKRCILILREIPKETPKEVMIYRLSLLLLYFPQSVFMLFKGEGCPNFISCDFAENDCWYVTFCSEDEAQQVKGIPVY
jgi:la-related protein 4